MKYLVRFAMIIFFMADASLVYGENNVLYHNESIEWQYIAVKSNDTYQKLFGDNWYLVAKINKIDENNLKKGQILKVPINFEKAKNWSPLPVYLESKNISTELNIKDLPQFVMIDLEHQYMACYEYGEQKYWYPISSGKEDKKTPERLFK